MQGLLNSLTYDPLSDGMLVSRTGCMKRLDQRTNERMNEPLVMFFFSLFFLVIFRAAYDMCSLFGFYFVRLDERTNERTKVLIIDHDFVFNSCWFLRRTCTLFSVSTSYGWMKERTNGPRFLFFVILRTMVTFCAASHFFFFFYAVVGCAASKVFFCSVSHSVSQSVKSMFCAACVV